VRGAWSSPAIAPAQGEQGELLILQNPDGCSAHDPATGQQLWWYEHECGGIASPLGLADVVLVQSQGMSALKRRPATSEAEVLWQSSKLDLGNGSPLVFGNKIYAVNRAGAVTCGSLDKGEVLWRTRVRGPFWTTPVLAGGHLYCVNQDGVTSVVKLGDTKGEVIAENKLGEPVFGSPAVSGNALYIRTDAHLWKIAEK
jgi:outer membrane protein assembly factor BamB